MNTKVAIFMVAWISYQVNDDDNSDGRQPRITDIQTTYPPDGVITQITSK